MKVRLLKDIYQDGGLNPQTGEPMPPVLKTTVRPNRRQAFHWFKGTVIEMSEASGQKYIDAGDAEKVEDSTEETE